MSKKLWDFIRNRASPKQSNGNVSNSSEQSPQNTSQTSPDSVTSTEQQSQSDVANAVAVQDASHNAVSVSSTVPSTKATNQESSKKLKRAFHSIETLISQDDIFKRKKSIDDVRSPSIEVISASEPSSSNQQQQPPPTSSTFSSLASKSTVLSPLTQMVQNFNFGDVGSASQSSSNKSSPNRNRKPSRNTTSADMSRFVHRNNYGSVASVQSDSGYSSVSNGQLSDVQVNSQLRVQQRQQVLNFMEQIRSRIPLVTQPCPQTVLQQHVSPLQIPNINPPSPKQITMHQIQQTLNAL